MAARKSVLGPQPKRPELDKLLKEAMSKPVTDEQLMEQRISFAYGNAPSSSNSTKDSVRSTSKSLRIAQG